MKVRCYNPLEPVDANQDVELEVDCSEASRLLENLLLPQSCLYVEASDSYSLDFYVESDNSLWVEITNVSYRFWAISEIDLAAGKEIIRIASENGVFSNFIPEMNREWDTYSSY
jgi:hypothetical protein